jgi:hypothetical protein
VDVNRIAWIKVISIGKNVLIAGEDKAIQKFVTPAFSGHNYAYHVFYIFEVLTVTQSMNLV